MKDEYYILDNFYIAQNAKAGSQTFGVGICQKLGIEFDNGAHSKFRAPLTTAPKGDVYLIMRDPVERFLAGCTQTKRTVEEAFLELHETIFLPQIEYTKHGNETKIYKFPEGIAQVLDILGLDPSIHVNPSEELAIATDEQLVRIREIYADDIKLYEAL